jgi:hypothetical protein
LELCYAHLGQRVALPEGVNKEHRREYAEKRASLSTVLQMSRKVSESTVPQPKQLSLSKESQALQRSAGGIRLLPLRPRARSTPPHRWRVSVSLVMQVGERGRILGSGVLQAVVECGVGSK